jgi:hypothetical protein
VVSSAQTDFPGGKAVATGIARDITEHRRTDAALSSQSKLWLGSANSNNEPEMTLQRYGRHAAACLTTEEAYDVIVRVPAIFPLRLGLVCHHPSRTRGSRNLGDEVRSERVFHPMSVGGWVAAGFTG